MGGTATGSGRSPSPPSFFSIPVRNPIPVSVVGKTPLLHYRPRLLRRIAGETDGAKIYPRMPAGEWVAGGGGGKQNSASVSSCRAVTETVDIS